MLPPDVHLKVAAALLVGGFGAIVLAGAPRKGPNLFLGVFLLLIAGNQGAEALRAAADDPAAALLWFRVATAFAALDPFFLFYFASVFPERNSLHTRAGVGAVLLGSVVFALAAPFATPPRWEAGLPLLQATALTAFTAVVYTVVLVRTLASMLEERTPRLPVAVLFLGLALAAVPLWPRVTSAAGHLVLDAFFPALASTTPTLSGLIYIFGTPFLVLLLLARHASGYRAARPESRRVALAGVGAGVALALAIESSALAQFLGLEAVLPALWFVGPVSAALRWTLFAVFASVAIVRHDLLGMSLAARRAAARFLVAFGALAAGAVVFAVARSVLGWDGSVSGSSLFDLAIVVAASQTTRSAIDRVAERIYGVPMPGERAAAIEAYRSAAERVAREGRPASGDAELGRLARELGLDRRSVEVLNRMAESGAPVPLAEGRLVAGRYRVARLLGRGGAGRAFLANDELLERPVVLKEVESPGARGEEEILHEARAASALQHPNVLTVHDVLRRPDGLLLVTEFAPGGSLETRLAERGPLPLDEGLRVVHDVLAGLEAIHARGIVHRDVKPGNVLLAADGTAKVADFGIARVRRGETIRFGGAGAGDRAGTPAFMAPEQRHGGEITPATDLYAVARLVERAVRSPIPAPVRAVVDRALAEDPAERFASAGEMGEALRAATQDAALTP